MIVAPPLPVDIILYPCFLRWSWLALPSSLNIFYSWYLTVFYETRIWIGRAAPLYVFMNWSCPDGGSILNWTEVNCMLYLHCPWMDIIFLIKVIFHLSFQSNNIFLKYSCNILGGCSLYVWNYGLWIEVKFKPLFSVYVLRFMIWGASWPCDSFWCLGTCVPVSCFFDVFFFLALYYCHLLHHLLFPVSSAIWWVKSVVVCYLL